jgi:alkylation response protein AidB-like acyl-CoA dehydrogenase
MLAPPASNDGALGAAGPISLTWWDTYLRARPSPLRVPVEALGEVVAAGALDPGRVPLPGSGCTWQRFRILQRIARHDLAFARLVEGHLDALAILAEAGRQTPDDATALGVWAAGRPCDVLAVPSPDGGYRLRGTRRWCSGAGSLSHALVTAAIGSGGPGERADRSGGFGAEESASLWLVRLDDHGVLVDRSSWPAVGMARTDTFDVTFADVPLPPEALVGAGGWYLERAGFWRGAAGVAACWWGGAAGVAEPLFERAAASSADELVLAAAGEAAALLWSMESGLRACAGVIDAHAHGDRAGEARVAQLARLLVERSATEVLRLVGDATGAGPLGHDRAHAARVADLTVYLRQHHGSRDAAALGRLLAASASEPEPRSESGAGADPGWPA